MKEIVVIAVLMAGLVLMTWAYQHQRYAFKYRILTICEANGGTPTLSGEEEIGCMNPRQPGH